MNRVARSITVLGVPFTQTAYPDLHFIFGKGVQFIQSEQGRFLPVNTGEDNREFALTKQDSKTTSLVAPVFENMVLDANWFRQLERRTQGILSPHSGMVFVTDFGFGLREEWRISSFGLRFYVETDGSDRLIISDPDNQADKLFPGITFNN